MYIFVIFSKCRHNTLLSRPNTTYTMCARNYNTRDYIKILYDLEEGLYNEPRISHFDIRREDADKSLQIMLKIRDVRDAGLEQIEGLLAQAKLLGRLAVEVQKFTAARIMVKTDMNRSVLEEIVIA